MQSTSVHDELKSRSFHENKKKYTSSRDKEERDKNVTWKQILIS